MRRLITGITITVIKLIDTISLSLYTIRILSAKSTYKILHTACRAIFVGNFSTLDPIGEVKNRLSESCLSTNELMNFLRLKEKNC